MNGAPLPADRVGIPIAVQPGRLIVVAVRNDGTRVETAATIDAGTMANVTLSVPAAPASGSPAQADPSTEAKSDGEESGFGAVRAVGIAVAALSVAGFVTFGVENAAADDRMATLEAACGDGPCTDPSLDAVIDEGKTAEVVAGVGLAVGIAGALAATAMIVFGGDDAEQATVAVGPGGVGLRLRF